MPSVLTREDELLCTWAAFPAGYLASRPFLDRIEGLSPAAVGWGAVAVLVWAAGSLLGAALLSMGYERSRLPTKRKQTLVLLIGPAVPVAGFVVCGLLSRGPSATQVLGTVGVGIGGSLTMSLLVWGTWRGLLWVEQRRGRRAS